MRYGWRLTVTGFIGGCLMVITAAAADPGFFTHHEKGWHFYHELIQHMTPRPRQASTNKAKRPATQSHPDQDPEQTVKALRHVYQQALSRAFLHPTIDNLKAVIRLQNRFSNQATQFAHQWQQALLASPELDFSVTHPTQHMARQIALDRQATQQHQTLHHLSKRAGLVFFYKAGCPYCRRFAPLLKAVAARYSFHVVPVTLDGQPLPAFPQSRPDHGQAHQFHVKVTPSLFLVAPAAGRAVPVSHGLVSQQTLVKRLVTAGKHLKEASR